MSHYRDNLIGKGGKPGAEITRGNSGRFVWSVTADTVIPGRVRIDIRRAGTNARVALEAAPNYLLAEILRSIASEA